LDACPLKKKKKKEMKLPLEFYLNDALEISRSLLGMSLFTQIDGQITGGKIIETEAYRGAEDRASHAYKGRRTKRTEVMFQQGGVAYVYLCYGMHHLFNVVTGPEELPHAVLIRAIEPHTGIELMRERRGGKEEIANGPGSLTQALGIDKSFNALSLLGDKIWISPGEIPTQIHATARIGVAYAGCDAALPWRYHL
jgi:DNA-3-methyladenine glycosylase